MYEPSHWTKPPVAKIAWPEPANAQPRLVDERGQEFRGVAKQMGSGVWYYERYLDGGRVRCTPLMSTSTRNDFRSTVT